MKCTVCQTAFNRVNHVPTNLPCGHTVCIDYVNKTNVIRCPVCSEKILSWKMFMKYSYPPNLALLDELDEKKRKREEKRVKCRDLELEVKADFIQAKNKCRDLATIFGDDSFRMEEILRGITNTFELIRREVDKAEKEVKIFFTGTNMPVIQAHSELQSLFGKYNELVDCFQSDSNKIQAAEDSKEPDNVKNMLTSYIRRKEEIDAEFDKMFSEKVPKLDEQLAAKVNKKIVESLGAVTDTINRLKAGGETRHTRDVGVQADASVLPKVPVRWQTNAGASIFSSISKLSELFK